LDQVAPIEKILKWFYGSSLSMVQGSSLSSCPADPSLHLSRPSRICRVLFGSGGFGKHVGNILEKAKMKFAKGTARERFEALSVGQSFLLLKKGSPVVTEELKEETKLKHRKALEDRQKGLHSRLRDIQVQEDIDRDDQILIEISRTVRELFGKSKFQSRDGTSPFPSLSGHFHTNRKKGGAASLILEAWRKSSFSESGVRCPETDSIPLVEPRSDRGYVDLFHYPGQMDRFCNWIRDRCAQELSEGCPAVPIQILEPLKVRTVTCGPEVCYWLMMELQQFMWEVLKSHPTFELIGKPISEEAMNKILEACTEGWFLSGDFSGATDNIRKCFSEHCFREICTLCKVPDWIRDIGIQCLVNHRLFEDRPDFTDPTWLSTAVSFTQENGQLMGSPLSFPILCVLNAAVCRMSFWDRSPKLRKLPLRINGDDCVLRLSAGEKERWYSLTAHVGLEPSPGKCYWAPDFLQMNSELFMLWGETFRHVPFWNISFLRDRSAKGDDVRTYESLGDLARSFVFGRYPDEYPGPQGKVLGRKQLWNLRKKAISTFIGRQRELLSMCPTYCSWYLPKLYGGLGIPNKISVIKQRTDKRQLRLATWIQKGLLGKGTNEIKNRRASPFGRWKFDCSPWLNQALRETHRFETSRLISLDPFSDLVTDLQPSSDWFSLDEEETWWEVNTRMSQFGPVLWEFSNRRSFAEAQKEAKALYRKGVESLFKGKEEELEKLREEVGRDYWDLNEEDLLRIKTKTVNKTWYSTMRKAEKGLLQEEILPIERFLCAQRIQNQIHALDVAILDATVAAPRNLLTSIPVLSSIPSDEGRVDELLQRGFEAFFQS